MRRLYAAMWLLLRYPEGLLEALAERLHRRRTARRLVVSTTDPARLYWQLKDDVQKLLALHSDRAVRTIMPATRHDAVDIEWLALPDSPRHRIALTARPGLLALLEERGDGAWEELQRSGRVERLVTTAAVRAVAATARHFERRLPATAHLSGARPLPRLFDVETTDRWSSSLHRSGWEYAMAVLSELHDPDGAHLEGFAESLFLWGGRAKAPFTRSWVCFIHNPPMTPEWTGHANHHLFRDPTWQASRPWLRGVFTLSEYHARHLRGRLDVPVSAVRFPMVDHGLPFDPDRFRANERRALIQIGTWLRRPDSLYRLRTTTRRVRLDVGWPWEAQTAAQMGITMPPSAHVEVWPRLSNEEYDAALTENVVFLDLIDSSANNAIVECIVRHTPILVNRIPPVEEYLGSDYPLLYDDLDSASRMADDMERILDAHRYLRETDKTRFSAEAFIAQVLDSDVAAAVQADRT